MDLLAPVLDQIAKIWAKLDLVPSIRWGTVTQSTPLRLQLDGDADPLPITPQTVLRNLAVGRRVVCIEQHRRVIVIAVAGGGLATQAEVDAGTDNGSSVSPATMRGAAWAPWATAAGIAASAAGNGSSGTTYWDGGVTVTLPAGRFTEPPIITVTAEGSGQVLSANLISRTATSFVVRTIRFGRDVAAGTPIHWTAVQMRDSAAAG